ncbi:unnamed protein product [Arabidopsis thaliana]|uniref:ADP-ribosyl cyclase/cyclic ADP-ribose hydrolase n=1 Tax=Arabidopsis thaliana TaxID=3702 RepID=A0A5S9WMK2_ARATH|nr:unnamed protein product [Arabidopsis thaliana]
MASSSSSSLSLSFPSSSLCRTWEHDVFPSFHGPDVRKTFLSHVLKEFSSKAINLFIDNEIKRGEFIGPELKRAIRGSKIVIVLLSKNYASSSWCLDELVEIMKKESGQKVITIFYEVDPTDVKKQKGDFGKAFKKTCKGKGKKKIKTWRKALEDVATIAGYHSSKWVDEATNIEKIAADISKMLNHLTPSHDFDHLIGMSAHMERMEQYLRLDLDEVRMIGIWGPAGIGKSTIARFLFNQVSTRFQNSALIEDIKGSYPRPCLDVYKAKLKLQKKMMSRMINQKDIVISNLGVAQERLRHRTVLLVLDDVDQFAQLDALAKDVKWFGPKSRIIITTEDKRLLKAHGIDLIYKVDFPSTNQALQMFCMYAFDQKSPKDGFYGLAHEITYLVGELPLALEVMGSYFRGLLSKEQWSMEVSRLRINLNGDIESILKFSYDALCDEDKDLFLHIACFFNGKCIKKVKEILAKKFKDLNGRLYVLEMKSLISYDICRTGEGKYDFYEYIHMHTLLAQLGEEIVRKQPVHERQFLINHITTKAVERMYNLQFLSYYTYIGEMIGHQNIITPPEPLTFISPKLRLLHWSYFPMTCLRFTNDLEFLFELKMTDSKLEKLWDGTKLLQNFKRMDLSNSENLKELPNLSMATSLDKLKLTNCSSLVELPSSIGNATNLRTLELAYCSSLVELPSSIGNLTNLITLNLTSCSSLVKLPSSIGNATNLQRLELAYCSSLVELPSSTGNLTNLEELDLSYCSSLVKLPSSIGNATKLDSLNLSDCSGLLELPSSLMDLRRLKFVFLKGCSSVVELPSSVENLSYEESLDLDGWTSLVELPSSIGNATFLTKIYLRRCSSLVELPSSIGNLTNLQELALTGCSSLVSLPQLPDSLMVLKAQNCESLEKLGCSFCNPGSYLNFINCFKLNQEARDLLIQTSTGYNLMVLPGKEVPACFTYRGYGSSVTVNLNQKHLPTSTKFKACILFKTDDKYGYWPTISVYTKKNKDFILLDNKGAHKDGIQERGSVSCPTESTLRNSFSKCCSTLTEHLYIFEVEAEGVTSTELVFDFKTFDNGPNFWTREIKECGIIQLLEHHVASDEDGDN